MHEIDFDGRREDLDKDCGIINSDLCYWMAGRSGCGNCYIHMLKGKAKKEEARDKWKETLALFPADIDSLHETDECQFCKDGKQKADGYAFIEMAHVEPYYEKGMIFGLGKKIRTPVGSLLSVQASVCPSCRKRIRILDYTIILAVALFIAIAIVLLSIPQIAAPMGRLFALLPVIFMVLMGVAGYMTGRYIHVNVLKKMTEKVKIDYSDIPVISRMLARGWFFFQVTNGLPRVSFSKTRQYDHIMRPEPANDPEDEEYMPLDNMNI
jgi:hypothetical protein